MRARTAPRRCIALLFPSMSQPSSNTPRPSRLCLPLSRPPCTDPTYHPTTLPTLHSTTPYTTPLLPGIFSAADNTTLGRNSTTTTHPPHSRVVALATAASDFRKLAPQFRLPLYLDLPLSPRPPPADCVHALCRRRLLYALPPCVACGNHTDIVHASSPFPPPSRLPSCHVLSSSNSRLSAGSRAGRTVHEVESGAAAGLMAGGGPLIARALSVHLQPLGTTDVPMSTPPMPANSTPNLTPTWRSNDSRGFCGSVVLGPTSATCHHSVRNVFSPPDNVAQKNHHRYLRCDVPETSRWVEILVTFCLAPHRAEHVVRR